MRHDYPYIERYGRQMASNNQYIKAQIEKAKKDKAPIDAVYYDIDDKKWVTIDEYPDGELKRHLLMD